MKPLYDALLKYSGQAAAVFHMPGHKLGRGFIPRGAFDNPAGFDVTELNTTDDLHSPRGPLLEAQTLAARAFGAGRTWFLANGSSCGIHAMIAANCRAGQKLLIARDFHYSAFNAMRFARVRPAFMPVSARPGNVLSPGAAEAALSAHPDAAALYLTRPGYYGGVCDIAEIARLAHRRGIPVLVDEAHGAHLAFSRRLPVSALEGGADYCVQSAYKTLPAFTQCAYAHASNGALSKDGACAERFSAALCAFQTSSPSFILTASLDYAREFMEERGARELDRILNQCERFYREMEAAGYGVPDDIRGCAPHGGDDTGENGGGYSGGSDSGGDNNGVAGMRYGRDMTRLVLNTTRLGLSGADVANLLWSRFKIMIEMSDPFHIIMISTVSDADEDFALLKGALAELASDHKRRPAPGRDDAACATPRGYGCGKHNDAPRALSPTPGDMTDSPACCSAAQTYATGTSSAGASGAPQSYIAPDFMDDLHASRRYAPLICAEGRTAADLVVPYPPGIPLLCPGETIDAGAVREIGALIALGTDVRGVYGAADVPADGKDDVCNAADAPAADKSALFAPDAATAFASVSELSYDIYKETYIAYRD